MTLDEVKVLIKSSATKMDALYGKAVFDEWAIVSLAENRGARAGLRRPAVTTIFLRTSQ
ncbi:MAG: hypothetical protein WDN00_05700 [Limisphaerales bacterium]